MNTKTTARTYVRRMEKYIPGATAGEWEQAAQWYNDAQVVAYDVANRMKVTLEVGACVISAFSPRQTWARNLVLAQAFADGEATPGLSNSRIMAERSLVDGFGALKGPKTNAFARAIAGDEDAVVVDSWMCKAAGIGRDTPSVVQYRRISEAITTLARRHGVSPRTMQALIWIRVRGKAD